jgi:hypothetical protein
MLHFSPFTALPLPLLQASTAHKSATHFTVKLEPSSFNRLMQT